MILESQVLALNAPSSRTVKDFRNWFKSKSIPVLWDRDEHLFENENDLVALAPVDTDRLNLFLKSYFAWFFKVRKSPFSSHLISRDAPCSKHHSQQLDQGNLLCRFLIYCITHEPIRRAPPETPPRPKASSSTSPNAASNAPVR